MDSAVGGAGADRDDRGRLGASRSSHSLVVIGCPVAGSLPNPHQYPSSWSFSFGMDPSTTRTNGSSSPRSALKNHARKSSAPPVGPHSKSMRGQWTAILGRPGSAPSAISSMLGCVAAVSATESPSQLKPALIHRTWIKASSALTAASLGICHSFLGAGLGPPWSGGKAPNVALDAAPASTALVSRFTPGRMSCQRILVTYSCLPERSIHRYQFSIPSPVLADSGKISAVGLIDLANFSKVSRSKSTCGSRSILLMHDQARGGKHMGILQRLIGALGHRDDDQFAGLTEVE